MSSREAFTPAQVTVTTLLAILLVSFFVYLVPVAIFLGADVCDAQGYRTDAWQWPLGVALPALVLTLLVAVVTFASSFAVRKATAHPWVWGLGVTLPILFVVVAIPLALAALGHDFCSNGDPL